MSALEIHYQQHTIEALAAASADENARGRLKQVIRRAQRRTHENLLPKIAVREDEAWTIKDAPPPSSTCSARAPC